MEKSDQETCKTLDCTSGRRHSVRLPTCKIYKPGVH